VTEGTSLAGRRERLVAEVLQTSGIRDERIAAALRDVPRHLFLPHLPPADAYLDDAIVTKRDADGQPISSSSQPAIMAIMLDQLTLAPGQRVLEIGAGTGYNAALMRHIVGPQGTVISVDIDDDLVGRAREHLASAGYPDVTVVAADGADGYPAGAPYDRVIATVGVSDLAPAWLDQVGPGARIVVPLDVRGSQLAVAFGRSDPAGTGSAGPSHRAGSCGCAGRWPARNGPWCSSLGSPSCCRTGSRWRTGTRWTARRWPLSWPSRPPDSAPGSAPVRFRSSGDSGCGWRPVTAGRAGSPKSSRPETPRDG
jgi:protein-L-isoaspartate(D-aspartate) O-methyltransferase